MDGFITRVENGNYHIEFDTDNHEHYEYMQRAARTCIDGHFFGCNLSHSELAEQYGKAKALVEQREAKMAEMEKQIHRQADVIGRDNARIVQMEEQIQKLRSELSASEAARSDLAKQLIAARKQIDTAAAVLRRG